MQFMQYSLLISQYLNGLSYVTTQLCCSGTSFLITLALQHRTCVMQFPNILCHKIVQLQTVHAASSVQQ